MAEQATLTVGEVAKRSGVAVSTLHYYEQRGLIKSWRTAGNQRRYPRSVLRKIAVIRVAQRTGIPLDVIYDCLSAIPDHQAFTHADWQQWSEAWRAELDARIITLTRLRDDLNQCIGCGCLSLQDCPLRNPDDILGKDQSGAPLLENLPDTKK